MFYNIDNIKFSLFNEIASLKKHSLKSVSKKGNNKVKKFKKIHTLLWIEFMLLHYLSGDEPIHSGNTEEE